MARARPSAIDKFGRLLIPKEWRERVGLTSGKEVRIVAEGNELRLIPQGSGGHLEKRGSVKVITGEAGGDLREAVARHRSDRLRQLSGKRR
jgi:AbrB family looped-hinge helix DNA binding protein